MKSLSEKKERACHKWLYDWFNEIYRGESALEGIRISLQDQIGKLPKFVSDFGSDTKGLLTTKDLWKFIQGQKLSGTSEHAYCIMKLYQSERDEKLAEDDIRRMIIPTVLRSERNYSTQFGSTDFVQLFTILISKEINFINQLSQMSVSLSKLNCSAYEIFSLILTNSHPSSANEMNSLNLMEYFSRVHNSDISADFADLVIRRLDRDKDNVISYLDFMNTVYCHNIQEFEQRTERILSALKTPAKSRRLVEHTSGEKIIYKKLNENRKSVNQVSRSKPSFNQKLYNPTTYNKSKEIASMLKKFIHKAKILEKEKQELAERIDFTITKAWEIFSPEDNFRICITDFSKKCRELGVKGYSVNEYIDNIKNITKDNYITKSVFEEYLLMPQRRAYRKLLRTRDKTDQEIMVLSKGLGFHTMKLLTWVLELSLEHIDDTKCLKESLKYFGITKIRKEEVNFNYYFR